jgi:hypothetical protein
VPAAANGLRRHTPREQGHDEYIFTRESLRFQFRERPCRCEKCFLGEYEECINKQWAGEVVEHTLEAAAGHTEYVTRRRVDEVREAHAKSVKEGDVVACEHTDKENSKYEYYLLLASGPGYEVIQINPRTCTPRP